MMSDKDEKADRDRFWRDELGNEIFLYESIFHLTGSPLYGTVLIHTSCCA